MSSKSNRKLAKLTNLDIRSIVESNDTFNYFFKNPLFARHKIKMIKERYIVDKENQDFDHNEVLLWIRNYEVSEQDRISGFKGNFGRIFIKVIEPEFDDPEGEIFNGETYYTLCIEKVHRPLYRHPDRKIVKSKHPNWGHPVLRTIKNDKAVYSSQYEAYSQLRRLESEYPNITILVRNLLYIIVYSRASSPENRIDNNPTQKIILEVIEIDDEQFKITWRPNPVKGFLQRDKINIVPFSFLNFEKLNGQNGLQSNGDDAHLNSK